MLEVCERFGMRIDEYMSLPPGERALYDQYMLVKREIEARTPVFKFGKGG